MLCNKQFCHFSGLPLVGPLNFICTYGFFQFLYKQIVIFWNALLVMHSLSVQWERYAILLLIRIPSIPKQGFPFIGIFCSPSAFSLNGFSTLADNSCCPDVGPFNAQLPIRR